ncbi:hypothetical protein SELMODRAFT_107490 [Selaginella moellendorffii]|uniref:Pentacotripeptide-repeat region of PRORP domain-containing protein n=2 Tax=Selaginella moellendorffii TaxID=88036 RepID=D8S3G5_SELML|nr:hypothetical protein SELMODRAFT_107490 [Selaginella moellendorffii]
MPTKDLCVWTTMIGAYAQEGEMEEAKSIFDQIPETDLVAWTTMITGYSRTGQLESAKLLFDSMAVHDIVSWNAMLSAYAMNNRIEDAKAMFEQMPHRGLSSWNSMLCGYVQTGHIEQAKVVFNSMPQQDSISFNEILACEDLQTAFGMFHTMCGEKTVVTWNAMLAAYAQSGDIALAKAFFDKMPEKDIVTWNTMLAAYAQNRHYLEAFALFEEAKILDVTDQTCFVSVLIACSRLGDLENGRKNFFMLVESYGFVALKQHYSCMVDLVGRAASYEAARDLIENMPFEPDSLEWTCLLGAAPKTLIKGTNVLARLDGKRAGALALLANSLSSSH